ncbi:MAG TPA: choice-of-anchor X domain-containing protein [Bacteroidales bacterium]|nr:choice-of-anchor X domain-containing protein [Bacteroidales bacterium]
MKKIRSAKLITVICITLLLLFNAVITKSQDIIDKAGSSFYGCTPGTLEIPFSFSGAVLDSSIVIENISGFRLIVEPASGDKRFNFCAANNHDPCYTLLTNDGEFTIRFKENASFVSVSKVYFNIYGASASNITVTAFQGATPVGISGTSVSGGLKYDYNSATPCDYIRVVSAFNSSTDPLTQAFSLDELHLPTECIPPATPTITPSGPLTFCSGGSVTLTSSAGTTYLWSNGATTQSIVVSTSGSYSVQVTNAQGCQSASSAPATVTVNALPATPTITPGGPLIFCSGGSVNLTSSAGTTYQWSNGATTQTINVNTSGSYTVRVTNAAGCQSAPSSPATVTVNPLPAAAGAISGTANVNQGQSGVSYSVSPVADATGYQWNYTGTGAAISGTTSNVTIDFSAGATSGVLTVRGSNTCGNGPVSPDFPITVTGGAGTLVPEVVCLMDLSWSMNRDFYDHTTSDPNAVKLIHAKNSLAAFVGLLYSNNDPESSAIGLARFPNSPQTGCDAGIIENLQTLGPTYHSSLLSSISSLVADGNSTPLFAGIDKALEMLISVPINRTIVLLTDGRQNCPYSGIPDLITNVKTSLSTSGVKLYTIGFGAPGIVPNDLLNEIASSSGGMHYNIADEPDKGSAYDPSNPGAWDPFTALDATFSHIIVDGLGLSYTSDPLAIISSGTKADYDIPVTPLDERICFFVSWVTSQDKYLGVKLFTPSGTELPLTQEGVLSIYGSNHTIITLAKELLNQPGMAGTWKLEIDGSGIANNSEHYQYSVINKSRKLELKTWFEKRRYFTGDKINIFLQVLLDGKPFAGLEKLSGKGTQPKVSLGNWLITRDIDNSSVEKAKQKQLEEYLNWIRSQGKFKELSNESKENYLREKREAFINGLNPVELRVHALMDEYKVPLPGRIMIKGLSFSDNGKNGDQKKGDGIYTSGFTPKKEGSYIFNISCTGTINEQKVIRESHLQTYVSTRIRVRPVIRDVRLKEAHVKGQKIYDVILALKDKYGNIPMPDALYNVKLSIDKGTLIEELADNMDGTFTQKISLPDSVKPKDVIMTTTIDDISGSKKLASYTLRWVLGIVIIILVVVRIFYRKGK